MNRSMPILIILVLTVILAVGLWQLFELRFEGGDVYPPYSSLRADPLGTMAIYESLGKMPGITTHRDFSTANLLPEEPDTAYLHLAAEPYEWTWMDKDLYREIKNFLARGGRLVITYGPETEAPYDWYWDEDQTTNSPDDKNDKKDVKNDVKKDAKKIDEKDAKKTNEKDKQIAGKDSTGQKNTGQKSAIKHKKSLLAEDEVQWEDEMGFHAGFKKLVADGDTYAPVEVFNKSESSLPRVLDWHSGMIFTNCDSKWRVIYARDTNAVVIERYFDKGSVVIASDSYFLSNEAMTKDRHADLLAWIVGPARNVVFDEAHMGVLDTDGVATLIRKYRLHGLVAGLLLLAGLFIWKNSTSLVPPRTAEAREDFIAGKDAASGFVNLLRRSVLPRDLLATCFTEWQKTAARSGKYSEGRRRRAETAYLADTQADDTKRNPVATYRKLTEILGNRRDGQNDGGKQSTTMTSK